MIELSGRKRFPCPVCTDPREVRMTKKRKPYITCDPCGIQLFIRGPAGVAAFNRLIDRADGQDLWARLAELERRCRLKCPVCGTKFWISPELVETSLFDGSLKGFRCPNEECGEIVPWNNGE